MLRKWNYAGGENVKVYSLVYDIYSSHICKVDSEDSSALSSTGTEERTLAMIKPDGLSGNYTDQIKIIILESGFNIVSEKMFQLDAESAAIFYAEHSGRSFFPSLIKYMTSGPVYTMILEKSDAISHWRALIGPTDARKAKVTHPNSMRAICGSDSQRNCVHGSDSPQSAAREISFFFGELSTGISTHDEL
ncbi:putative nucleoside diphosphate kinase 5 [Iris pallida]|uniref:Nucleoside diphosphate kinase n=1 Tax=Iris pallida TaxID=29817 RepID=A0AAX6EMF7_IRIPA|nr:putative nucleoside diphosphate kinase 5 [Iris pallida]